MANDAGTEAYFSPLEVVASEPPRIIVKIANLSLNLAYLRYTTGII